MLTIEQVEENKKVFIELVRSITIEGSDIEGLIQFLDSNGFFVAPATSISHGNYDGGLCEHSLNVYNRLVSSLKSINLTYSDDTIKIVGLLHDLSKVGYYEKYSKNVKNELTGKWESVEAFRIKDAADRATYGDASVNSFLTISRFIPLSQEEIATIINFNCGMDNGYSNKDIYGIMEKYPLVVLLHNADMISSFVDKK